MAQRLLAVAEARLWIARKNTPPTIDETMTATPPRLADAAGTRNPDEEHPIEDPLAPTSPVDDPRPEEPVRREPPPPDPDIDDPPAR